MRRFAAAIAGVFALAFGLPGGAAQAQDASPYEGVWEGDLGRLPIRACFNEDGQGAYYYSLHLIPIALKVKDGDDSGALYESTDYYKENGAHWDMGAVSGDRATARWRKGRRSYGITLRRMDTTAEDFYGPCGSAEFFAPRLRGGSVKESAESFAGQSYTKLDYVPSGAFKADDLSITTLALSAAQPGDEAINRQLRSTLPATDAEHDFAQCFRMALERRGFDGYFQHALAPELISEEWLGVFGSGSQDCGGIHPFHWQHRRVFNRESGKEVDPTHWFKPEALRFYEFETADDTARERKRPVAGLSSDLLAKVRQHWPSETEDAYATEECLEMVEGFGLDLGLVAEGIVFKPNPPYVAMVCSVSVTVPWADLEPFLSDEGKAVRDSLRG